MLNPPGAPNPEPATCHTEGVAQKPKILESGRDMLLSLGAIIVIMIVMVLPTGMCSWHPGAPESGPVQEVDQHTFLAMEARSADFPIVDPKVPEGWIANSARRTLMAGSAAPAVGYVTPDAGFVQFVQTALPAEQAAPGEALREVGEATVHAGDERDQWVLDRGDVRWVLSGAATDEEFLTLIDAARAAQPL